VGTPISDFEDSGAIKKLLPANNSAVLKEGSSIKQAVTLYLLGFIYANIDFL
jgi:hypothetical protein